MDYYCYYMEQMLEATVLEGMITRPGPDQDLLCGVHGFVGSSLCVISVKCLAFVNGLAERQFTTCILTITHTEELSV